MVYRWFNYDHADVRHYIDFLTLPENDKADYAKGFSAFVENYRMNEDQLRARLIRNIIIDTLFVVAVAVTQYYGLIPLWIPGWYFAVFFQDGDTGTLPRLSEPVRGFLSEMGIATPASRFCLSTEYIFACSLLLFIGSLFAGVASEVNLAFMVMAFVMYPVGCFDHISYSARCRDAIERAETVLSVKAGLLKGHGA